MLERRREPLLPAGEFLRRVARFALLDLIIISIALALGVGGYHYVEGESWVDALLNASMILGGMGPVNPLHTTEGKLFASFYALFSGLVFIGVAGLLLAPFAHRLLHQFHIDADEDEDSDDVQPAQSDRQI